MNGARKVCIAPNLQRSVGMWLKHYEGKWDRNALDYLAHVDQWHVVCRAEYVKENQPRPARLLGIDLVLWRCQGEVQAWLDFCAYRGAPSND
jgi:DNA-binding protein Fis